MRKHIARLFLLGTQLILVAALACLSASTAGKYWFEKIDTISSPRINFGLITLCTIECKDRDTILAFKNVEWPLEPLTSNDFDIILITLMVSIVFAFLALLISLLLCCTVNGRKRWRIICSFVALMALIAVISCLIGIAYFEGKIGDERLSLSYQHGWSSIVAWLGFGLLVIDTVLLIIVTCVKPHDHSKKPHSVKTTASYASSDTQQTWGSSRDNKAFEFTDVQKDAFYIGKNQKGKLEPSIQLNTFDESKTLKNYRSSNQDEPDYGSPRGSNNLLYESDYRSSEVEYDPKKRSSEVAYDPRKRSNESGNNRRKRSFELAYDTRTRSNESAHDSKRQTYSSGYPNSSEYNSRRQTSSTEYDSRRQTSSTEHNWSRDTSGYDPRRKYSSPYDTDARTPVTSRYNPSNRKSRSSRYPNVDSDGYQMR